MYTSRLVWCFILCIQQQITNENAFARLYDIDLMIIVCLSVIKKKVLKINFANCQI